MRRDLLYIILALANYKFTRQQVEEVGNFLGQTCPALCRYPVVSFCADIEYITKDL